MATGKPDADLVRSTNWIGSIPVVLTLAPTSLGTTMMPYPIHLMLNRATYLHIGLKDAIQRLHKFAPATISFSSGTKWTEPGPHDSNGDDEIDSKEIFNDTSSKTNDATKYSFPVCWFEDEDTQIPLRWHLFSGVLFDMLAKSNPSRTAPPLPWKIRLHFSNYPSSQLLPLEPGQVLTTIERSFKNSLKQALFLQYGTSKIAMNMSKQIHERLWDSIVSSNYKLYQQISSELQSTDKQSVQLIPIRLYLDAKPPLQRPCRKRGKPIRFAKCMVKVWSSEACSSFIHSN